MVRGGILSSGKGFISQSQLSVLTVFCSLCTACVCTESHASTSIRTSKIPILTAIDSHGVARRNTKILHTLVGMGSAALAAAVASADPGKPTRISQLKGKKEV